MRLWERNAVAWFLGGTVGYFVARAVSFFPRARDYCSVVICGYDLTPALAGSVSALAVALVVWYWLE